MYTQNFQIHSRLDLFHLLLFLRSLRYLCSGFRYRHDANGRTAKLHARAVAKRLRVKEGLIFLPGVPSKTYEDSDQEIAFRQRRYFYYLSGISHPDCLVSYDIGRDVVCAWIPPPNTGRNVIYNGFTPSRTQIRAITDVTYVAETSHLKQYLKSYVKNTGSHAKFYLLHKSQEPKLRQHLVNDDGIDIIAPKSQFDFTKLQPAMDAARVVKSEHELKLIRKACEITQKAHLNVLYFIKDCDNEAEIEAIFAASCIAEQAKHQAYGIIAGSGENASTLHYVANNEPLEGRQLVCLDAGVEWKEYASDVTRTFPISGKWTPEAKSIYDIVAKMQDECIAMVKPGVSLNTQLLHRSSTRLNANCTIVGRLPSNPHACSQGCRQRPPRARYPPEWNMAGAILIRSIRRLLPAWSWP